MACKTSYELHHQFPKLADESGFTFNTHRPRVHIDWNKIKLIDIESLIRERKFVLVEQHINDILDCILESEFDVRILDDGVLKMFRLAQLAVEYQQFCRHYLDRSVYVLRQEIKSLAQELDTTKKNLHEKEEELRKLRKRTRHSYKTPLPYGNDNIAAMILKTLNNRGELFPTTSRGDFDQYNKCKYCEKVFLNQLYLQSHVSRRHANQMDLPEKETNNETHVIQHNIENSKLNTEVIELKNKLNEMEVLIANANKQDKSPVHKKTNNTNTNDNSHEVVKNGMKDVEVSTNNEDYLLSKIEEWKKEEHEKCNKEINILRNQIMETMNSFKQKETQPDEKDSNVIGELQSTIINQGAEISALKQELKQSEKDAEVKKSDRIKEAEEQISFWSKRAEAQSKQYEALLQKLNEVMQDAKESRELADTERKRASQLQTLLEHNFRIKASENNDRSNVNNTNKNPNQSSKSNIVEQSSPNQLAKQQSPSKSIKLADRETLENLHRKAQELLNMGSLSSSVSDSSSTTKVKEISPKKTHMQEPRKRKSKVISRIKTYPNKEEKNNNVQNSTENKNDKIPKVKERKLKKEITKSFINGMLTKESTTAMDSGSPVKVIRAKITEEVNSRLVSLGVDPLKSRLPQNVFKSQRMLLQKQQEIKSKKNTSHEKIRYSILAYLDSNTTNEQNNVITANKHNTQDKMPKPFRSLTSMISGVKSKAISLVKFNDLKEKDKQKIFSAEVAKRAISLLKTPPGTAPSSPSRQKSLLSNTVTQEHNDDSHRNSDYGTNAGSNEHKNKKAAKAIKETIKSVVINKSHSSESSESDQKYFNNGIVQQPMKSLDTLIKSPARRLSSNNSDYDHIDIKYTKQNSGPLTRTQSAIDLSEAKACTMNVGSKTLEIEIYESSDDIKSLSDLQPNRKSDDNAYTNKTKSVLKNASSTSSLNKKKVIFDMDAIQMKSLSATPSQSITEKSDNENYELGLVNLDTEEWDISSIENEPLKNDTKLKLSTRTSPKIAELKQTIESQLARRTEISSGLVGGVDVLNMNKTLTKNLNVGGSNTSLGSSILDESDSIPHVNRKAFAVSKKISEKEDSELDISEFSIDGITNTNKNESF